MLNKLYERIESTPTDKLDDLHEELYHKLCDAREQEVGEQFENQLVRAYSEAVQHIEYKLKQRRHMHNRCEKVLKVLEFVFATAFVLLVVYAAAIFFLTMG